MKKLALALTPVALAGCATLFDGSTQTVKIDSDTDGAQYAITNRAGNTVKSGVAPATVKLKGGAGYFQRENYTVTLKKPGYEDASTSVEPHMAGWYWGNLILGGALGMLIVDPITGAMYQVPEDIHVPMRRLEGEAAVAATRSESTYSSNLGRSKLPDNIRWSYQAEQVAMAMNCTGTSYASQGPGMEMYEASCGDNRVAIRCDFGTCEALR